MIAPGTQVFASYSAAYSAGFHLFAVHDLYQNNYVSELLPSMPPGSALAVFDNANQVWGSVTTYDSSAGWDYPNVKLLPGQGAFLFLPAPALVNIPGIQPTTINPVSIPPGDIWLVSRQTEAAPSSYDDIVGTTPTSGVIGFTFNGGFSPFSFDLFGDGTWDPISPSIALGNSVWFSGSSGGPNPPPLVPPTTIVTQPLPSVTVVCGQTLTLTVKVNSMSGPTIFGRWWKVTSTTPVIVQTVAATYPDVNFTIPAVSQQDSGDYYLEVLGNNTSGASVSLFSSISSVSVIGTGVNAVPTLNPIPNPTAIDEDAPMQTINLSGITAGPPGDNWQTLTLTAAVTAGNLNLFQTLAVQYVPGATTGTLTYKTAPDENGTATITITATDNGVTACLPDPRSKSRSFNVVVNKVNDAPSFNLKSAPNLTLVEDAPGVQTVAGQAINISKGPQNEATQTLLFKVVNDNNGLFTTLGQPAIDPTGTLKFQLKANQHGTANVTVQLQDGGSGIAPNINTAPSQTFVITVVPVPDAPTLTAFSAPLTGAVNGTPFTITYAALAALGNEFDADGDPIQFKLTNIQTANGALTLTSGGPLVPLNATLGLGQSWVWTPSVSGLSKPAFKVVATDGSLSSNTAVMVKVDVQ